MLKQCSDLEAFFAAADDRFVRCADFVAWHRGPDLLGMDVWGAGSPEYLARRARVVDHFTGTSCARQRLLFDSSGCRDASPEMFRSALHFWQSRRERHALAFDKVAFVVSSGYVGAVVTGLCALIEPGFSLRRFSEVEPALRWLGEPDAGKLAAELRALRCAADEDSATLGRLQQLLAEHALAREVGDVARRLGLSSRTLQRRLSAAGTTFQAELLRAKLARATTLMLTGRYTLAAIAFDLGFASPQHFSTRFAAIYGKPPSAWLRSYEASERGT